MALVVDERNRMAWVRLTPWFASEPWRSRRPRADPPTARPHARSHTRSRTGTHPRTDPAHRLPARGFDRASEVSDRAGNSRW